VHPRPTASSLVIGQVVVTAYMTGVIWLVQLVHYPLMAGWPHGDFGAWETRHRALIAPVVMPAMLAEGACAALLIVRPPRGVARWLSWLGVALLAGIWASTAMIQIPCHEALSAGWDAAVHERLVASNWIRTVLWSARLVVAVAIARATIAVPPGGPAGSDPAA